MSLADAELQDLKAGGDTRKQLLQDGQLFFREAARIFTERSISHEQMAEAARFVVQFRLDPREIELIAVEADFFLHNPASPAIKNYYLRGYEKAAEHLTFVGSDDAFTEAGWRLRWGAQPDEVNRAMAQVNPASAETVLDGRAWNLRGVLFNQKHDALMQEHGALLRPLGLYPPV